MASDMNKEHEIMFYEVFGEEEKALRSILPAYIKAKYTDKTIQDCDDAKSPAPFICIRTQSEIPIDWSRDLKAIFSRSAGFDHLSDFRQKSNTSIPLGYLSGYCSRAVAEQALLLSLSLLRKITSQMQAFDNFERSALSGAELSSQDVLVVGVGNIGEEIVKIFQSLGVRVRGVDIGRRVEGLEYIGLQRGIESSSLIICSLPLTKETNGLLNHALLKKCTKKIILVNISRGEVTPLADMKRLLDEGVVAGLALDVFEDEKEVANYLRGQTDNITKPLTHLLALREDLRVILTPHNAFNTKEALSKKAQLTIDAFAQLFSKGSFPTHL